MRKPVLLFLVIIAAAGVTAAWAPWLTPEEAANIAVRSFENEWRQVVDGCGFNCRGCGAIEAEKVPFGVPVEIEYACGLLPADDPSYHQTAGGFVSFLGTVHGLPSP
jgi:hypothetical protein